MIKPKNGSIDFKVNIVRYYLKTQCSSEYQDIWRLALRRFGPGRFKLDISHLYVTQMDVSYPEKSDLDVSRRTFRTVTQMS